MIIQTRIGEREIDESAVIQFPHGLIGLDEDNEFVLLTIQEESPFLLLQSLHKPELGLLVSDPYSFLPDYKVRLDGGQKKTLQLEEGDETALLVTVSIPDGRPEEMALNLTGPIVINPTKKCGVQVVLTDQKMPSHFKPMQDAKA
ncbi:MAG: flagellar assembly protein FliW [Desulfovibrio sp.]